MGAVATLINRSPVPYVGNRQSLLVPYVEPSGTEAQLRAMGVNGTIFAIVDKCATGVAAVDWKLWRKTASGKPEDRVEVTSHAALDLWNKPNPFMTRQELVEAGQQHHELTGETWWVVARDPRANLPLGLWVVRPDRMQPVPSATDYLAGYIYLGPDGEKIPLDLNQVIYQRRPNPMDPYRGIGPVQAALIDIEQSRYAKEWNRNFFRNGATPGGIVEVDRTLGDTEFNELRDRWTEQHQGVSNAHRVAILEGGLKWVERAYSIDDLQFPQLLDVTRESIREAFGFPKPLLGAVDDVNRANAEAAEVVFARWLILPRLERIKGALNNDLLPLFGAADLEFDYEDPVPENEELENAGRLSKSTAAKNLVDAGYDPVAVLEAMDLPEMANTPPAPPVLPVGSPGTPESPSSPPALPPGRRAPPAAAARLRNQNDPTPGERPIRDWDQRIDQLVERWTVEVTPAQINELAAQIEQAVDAGTPAGLATLTVDTAPAADLLARAMFDQATAGANRVAGMAAEQGVSIAPAVPDLAEVGMTDAAKRRPPQYAKPLPARTRAGLASDLVAASRVTTSNLGARFTASASTEALRNWAPASSGTDVAAAVRAKLEELTTTSLKVDLGGSVWAAENEGRFATLEQAVEDLNGATVYIATEVNDPNTCGPCESIDGFEFTSLAEAEANYPFGGYVDCEGGSQCRGSIEPDWRFT